MTGYASSSAQVAVQSAQPTTQNFALTPPGTIGGTVTDSSTHSPLAGVSVSDGKDVAVTTDSSGNYTIAAVAAGPYTVTASITGYTSGSATTTVSAGQKSTVSFALVKSATGPKLVQTAAVSAKTVSLPATSGAGHLLVLAVGVYTGVSQQISAVSDGKNTWTKIGAYAVSGQYSDGELWYAANAQAVSSVTVTTGATTVALRLMEFSGVATSSPLEIATGKAATSTAPGSGSVTTTGASDLVIGFIAGHGNSEAISVASGYTTQSQQTTASPITSVITGYKVAAAGAQSFSGSFATAMYWASGVVAFRAGS